MRLENYTNIPESKIRTIIKFVEPSKLITSRFDVYIIDAARNDHYSGHFRYRNECIDSSNDNSLNHLLRMESGDRQQILARISMEENKFPYFRELTVRKKLTLHWDEYDEKTAKWRPWHAYYYYTKIPSNNRLFNILTGFRFISKNVKRNKGYFRNPKGYIDHLVLSREEGLVYVLAHEFRHFWQWSHRGKRGKIWNARGKFSERDADAYAIKKVRAWRALYSPQDALQIRKFNWDLIEKDVVIIKDVAGVSNEPSY
jgi:hypothetical protein